MALSLRALSIIVFLLAGAHAQTQDLLVSDAPINAGPLADPLVLPETQRPDTAATAATAMAISPRAAATTARLRRTSKQQAAAALRQARPWRPMMEPQAHNTTGDVDPQAICGSNSLVADNQNTNCRIVTTYSNGVSTSCSAVKIGDKLLATAGHCLYTKPNGGWANSIDVYCTGSVACGVQRTTYATHMTTTPQWMGSVTTIPTAWDGAVIKTATSLPGRTLTLAQYARPGTYSTILTGYPAQSGDPGCETSAFAGACYQYSSRDLLNVGSSGMYSSDSMDLCSGHSGSGVMTADSSRYVVAIVSGASFSPCANYFVPQINSNAGVNKDCEKPEGGVSFACLVAKLPA